ncbi:MAG: polyphosphate polymerase domain-containing protein [Deltaproteobacteria bacterium]|nr:polyphosphate polymerase domain-containing protein [Deltaproteobacteria bacterium]
MTDDLSRIRRLELKYLLTEEQAGRVREYVRGFCDLDANSDADLGGYVVNNLYLDTPDLRFYWDVKNRKLTRFKTRVRYYGTGPADVIWLELKHKQSNVVWKTRRRMKADQWPGVLEPRLARPDVPRFIEGPPSFEEIADLYGVRPLLHVRYFREPWVSALDHYGRVTFDRRLSFRLARGSYELTCDDDEMVGYDDPVTMNAPDSLVLLEIKIERLAPAWAIRLIRRLGLEQRGFSKYCYAIDRTFEAGDIRLRQPRYAW